MKAISSGGLNVDVSTAVRLATAPELVRGYENVKWRNIANYEALVAELEVK
jgi:hypothetical protein